MTPAQRATNLKQIAAAAISIERNHQIPAELSTVQCILESGWLEKCPGNNCFGIKWTGGPFVQVPTKERLTQKQLDALGVPYTDKTGPDSSGKFTVTAKLKFQAYPDLSACFTAYADLLVNGRNFKDRFARYLKNRDLQWLLQEMSGSDGLPPYFTGAGYVELFNKIADQANVRAAIAAARAVVS